MTKDWDYPRMPGTHNYRWHAELLDPRLAGQVDRYHTWTKLRPQSVGEHSWQVARLLLAIYPEARRELIVEALFHDAGERGPGDLPYPGKRFEPVLKEVSERMERSVRLGLTKWGVPPPLPLSDQEAAALKAADMLDMWEWALFEISIGNRHAILVRKRCERHIDLMLEAEPSSETLSVDAADRVRQHMERRRNYEKMRGETAPEM